MTEAGLMSVQHCADSSGEDLLVSRLIARIAELEEKLYKAEFEKEAPPAPAPAPLPEPIKPPQPEPPRLGFLSAIRAGLRQLEESTGYVDPAEYQLQLNAQARAAQPRIVYYQHPPEGIPESLQQQPPEGALLRSETSSAVSDVSSATTSDWTSARLDTTATPKSPLDTPKLGDGDYSEDPAYDAQPSLRASASDGNLRSAVSASGASIAAAKAGSAGGAAPLSPFREGLAPVPPPPLSPPAKPPPQPQQLAAQQPASDTVSTASTTAKAATTVDWLSGLFNKAKAAAAQATQAASAPAAAPPAAPAAQPAERTPGAKQPSQAAVQGPGYAYNERTVDLTQQGVTVEPGNRESYSRYVFDPVDIAAEMEVTARVRKAAAEALMQAEAKLAAAEEARTDMLRQLEEAKELSKEIETLRRENEQALATRAALEDEMISSRAAVEAMKAAQSSLQEEVDSLKTQASIWQSAKSDEKDKLKQENQLIRNQLQTRLNELQVVKSKLNESDTERQRQARELEDLQNKLQWLTKINKQLETSAQQLEDQRKRFAEVQDKFFKERAVRRRLHEQLQQLRGNIRVMCRVRPPLPNQSSVVTYPLEGLLAISPPGRRGQEFEFDHVFAPETTQEAIYEEVSPLVRSCADGYNVCIFAYGQTGSGKTFTMEGPDDKPGINVRALQELFSIGSEEGIDLNWKVQVSMLEVYNDSLYDLLLPPGEVSRPLEVSGLAAGELPAGMERVQGAMWRPVNCLEDVKKVLKEGSRNRSTASTALNADSSRSHAVLSVRVTAHTSNLSLRSVIHLVDLAGSERVDKSEVTGQQLKEAQSINKSLSALGDVIAALQRRTPHVPFRNSKLTQVLQDSLCGSSKVLLVCNISPEANSAGETLSSLNFASRAAQVELGQARRAVVERAAQPAASERHKDGALTPQQSHGTAAGPPAPSPERGTAGPRSSGASARSGVRASQVAAKIATTPQGKDKEARDSHHATPT